MRQDHLKLIQKEVLKLLDFSPSLIVIFVDTGKNWQFDDLEIVYQNAAYKEFRKDIDNTNPKKAIQPRNSEKNNLQSIIDQVRTSFERNGGIFTGPYLRSFQSASGNCMHVEWNMHCIGLDDDGCPLHFVDGVDMTGEVWRMKVKETRLDLPTDKLSDREQVILSLLDRGLVTTEIADTLNISNRTVDTHRANIRKKLNIKDRSVSILQYLRSIRKD
jgi:DNA-binding CsgD family transcriptional regulator